MEEQPDYVQVEQSGLVYRIQVSEPATHADAWRDGRWLHSPLTNSEVSELDVRPLCDEDIVRLGIG